MDLLLYSLLLIEGADIAILPSSFKALEKQLGFTPTILAAIMTAQLLTQACCRPLWGSVADSGVIARKTMLAFCCCGWGVVTIALGFSMSWTMMLPLRVMNGVFLAVVHPTLQSIVADTVPSEERGKAFAKISIIEGAGGSITGFICTVLAMEIFWGCYGWSLVCVSIGLVSVAQGLFLHWFMREPLRSDGFQVSCGPGLSDAWSKLAVYMRLPSFQVVLVQGIFGATPFRVLAFKNMWLQSIGFSPATVASMIFVSELGHFPGICFGGWLGDKLAAWDKFKGRPYVAMMSLAGGAFLAWSLFTWIPTNNAVLVTLCLFWLSFQVCWCQVGCNRPVFAEIVASEHRASIMGWEIGLESVCSSIFGVPIVGYLSEHIFGYRPGTSDTANGLALGHAMLWMTVIPWLTAMFLYSTLPDALARDQRKESQPLLV